MWHYDKILVHLKEFGLNMYIRSKKKIKMRMETTVGLYGKGNEIIS
jgi:hypothetical protein